MSELYDISNEGKAESTEKGWIPKLPKEEYVERVQEWRTALFLMVNEQTLKAIESPKSYKCYFDLMVRFDYQIINTLPVVTRYPGAQLSEESVK